MEPLSKSIASSVVRAFVMDGERVGAGTFSRGVRAARWKRNDWLVRQEDAVSAADSVIRLSRRRSQG